MPATNVRNPSSRLFDIFLAWHSLRRFNAMYSKGYLLLPVETFGFWLVGFAQRYKTRPAHIRNSAEYFHPIVDHDVDWPFVVKLRARPDLNSITASDCQDIGNTAVVNSFLPVGIGISRSDEALRAKVNDHTRELGCGEGDGRMFESACARVDGIRRRLDGWRGHAIIRLEEGVGLLELADEAEGHGWTQDLGEQTTSSADVESIVGTAGRQLQTPLGPQP
ncbi:hypothetical protein F5146DRAFT_1139556 [Armillaria mellea]|nr:hypothetical protein F5146DRAFT_1139556 [Armillaria mellea]